MVKEREQVGANMGTGRCRYGFTGVSGDPALILQIASEFYNVVSAGSRPGRPRKAIVRKSQF